MDELIDQLPALKNFGIYFAYSVIFIALFQKIYDLVTPYDEWKLIKENNSAAALAFIGSILGFTLALASASAHSVSLIDYVIWALVALVAQVLTFLLIRVLLPKIVAGIEKNEVASGITLGGVSFAVGVINASCMFT